MFLIVKNQFKQEEHMEEKIAIVADTGCDLDESFVSENDVRLIPFRVIVDDREDYRDRFEIDATKVIDLLRDHSLATSLPQIGDITDVFNRVREDGYTHAVVLTTASGLSGTWSAIKVVAKDFDGLKIAVVDSETISMGLGFLVMQAVKMVKRKARFEEIVKNLEKNKKGAELTLYLDTLKYLQKSGRISELKAILGEVLKIKPVLAIKGGKFSIDSLNLSKRRALKNLQKKALKVRGNECIAIGYTGSPEEAREFGDNLEKELGRKIRVFHIGPALTLHAGPGLIGVLKV